VGSDQGHHTGAGRQAAADQDLLAGDLRGEKILIFTYYKDTARYLYRQLTGGDDFLAAAGHPHIARMDSGYVWS